MTAAADPACVSRSNNEQNTSVCVLVYVQYVPLFAALYFGQRVEIVVLSGIIRIHTVTCCRSENLFLVANK